MPFIISLFILLIASQGVAQTTLPRNLNNQEREKVASALGFGLSSKLLSNPYSLGGYEGYEFGVSAEFISLKEISNLGSGSSDEGDFTVYNLVFGKGLYYDVDIFVHFAPPFQEENIGVFGVQGRYKAWQSDDLPLIASVVLSAGGSQIQSLISSSTVATDLVLSMITEDIALYFGGGYSRLITRFTGGAGGITNDQASHLIDLGSFHSLFGMSVQVDRIYFAFQMDRYQDVNYSAKMGYRF